MILVFAYLATHFFSFNIFVFQLHLVPLFALNVSYFKAFRLSIDLTDDHYDHFIFGFRGHF